MSKDHDKVWRKRAKLRFLGRQRAEQGYTPSRITEQDIRDSVNDDIESRLIEAILNRLNKRSTDYDALMDLPVGPRSVFATWLLESDVMNGGFEQFFFNQPPHVWDIAIDGYTFLRMEEPRKLAVAAARKQKSGAIDFEFENNMFCDRWHKIKQSKELIIRQQPSKFALDSEAI